MTALHAALEAAFDARRDLPQISVLPRRGAAEDLTGAALRAAAQTSAAALRAWLGPGPHSLVLALPPGSLFITTLLGCLLAGICAVPAPVPRAGETGRRFAHVARSSGASAVLCAPGQVAALRAALDSCGTDVPVAALPLGPDAPPPRSAGHAPGAVVQYTSGSTRMPRGAVLSAENILANCARVERVWGMDAQARFVNWLPHYHDMGLMGGLLYPLLSGGYSAQMSPLDFVRDPARWLQAIHDTRASFSGGPAFAFAQILTRVPPAQLASLDLSCWTRAYCGAEPAPQGLLDAFHAHLAPAGLRRGAVFACYGLAEATLYAGGAPGGTPPAPPPDAAGEPCALPAELRADLAILAPDGRPVREGDAGEICLRGPSVAAGYLPASETEGTASPFAQAGPPGTPPDWLRTGDLGLVQDGWLWITGRLKDVLICNGRKIPAPEVEWRACAGDPALDPLAAAAFTPGPGPQAVLLAETCAPLDETAARAAARRAVRGAWGLELTEVIFLRRGRLPRTSSGKIRRAAAAQAWAAGAYAAAEAPCPR